MEQYKRTARTRWQAEKADAQARRERAWRLAHRAAALLKDEYGVQRIVVFGSLVHPDRFTRWSDVDLAAWGLTARNWLQASAAVRGLSDEIELNLVDIACCAPELLAAIEREGMQL
ncbi:MAG TPA: nucleotidyltransferase domain-containing protein [Anaerolineae bacterium]|nr:nucleotidyltransferase domain-containing protein [Anaerolineae bacterium]